jgi:hypothetical protein
MMFIICMLNIVFNLGRLSSKETTPTGENVRIGLIHLINALAACIMSARLRAEHRKWAVLQLVQALGTLGRGVAVQTECLADTARDLPQCPVNLLEAHQHRVTSCVFHHRKGFLATRLAISLIGIFLMYSSFVFSV